MSSLTRISPKQIVDNTAGSQDNRPNGVDLPLAGIVAQAPVESPQRFQHWPGLNARLTWAHDVSLALSLPRRERAVLKHVVWRSGKRDDGKAPGCWESTANIGLALDYHRSEVGQALAALVQHGLLTAFRRFSQTTVYRPTLASSYVGKPDIGMSENPTLTRNLTKRVRVQDSGVPYGNSIRGGDSVIVDNADSCGFAGCPTLGQPCPACGRHRGAVENA